MKTFYGEKLKNRVVSVIAVACLAAACFAGFGAERVAADIRTFTSDFNISEIRVGDVIDATSGPVTVTNDIPYATRFYGIDIAIYRDETDKDVVNVRPNLHYTFNGKKFTCVRASSGLYEFKPDSFPTDGTYYIYVEGGVAKVNGTEVTSAATGTKVTLTANSATEEGQQFYGWEVKSSAWLRDNNSSNNAYFYMPQNEVRVKAIYGPVPRNVDMFTFYPAAAGTAEFRDNYGTYEINPKPLTQGYSIAYYTYTLDGTPYSSRNSGTLPFSYNPNWDPMTFQAPNTLIDIEVYCAADISITNGSASVNSSAVTKALPNETVTITAQMPEGQTFLKWTTSTPGVTFADASSATTTFTMPEVPVTIKALPAVGGVTLDPTNKTVDIGDSFTISATVTPDDTPDKTVTWSVDRMDIASVTDGVVTGVKGGTAVVTATAGSKSATCTVTVPKEALDLSLSIEGWQAGEEAKQPVLTGNVGNGTVTVEYKEKNADDSTYTNEVPTTAGIYTVRIAVEESEHYLGGTVTADFEITAPEPNPAQPVSRPATEYYVEPKPTKTPEQIYKAPTEVRSANKQKLDSGLGVTQNNGELTISWGEVPDAEYYEVYVAYLSVPFEKVDPVEIKGATGLETKKINGKSIDSTKNFKLKVEAYKTEDGKKIQIGKSLTLYVAGESNQDYTNVSGISVNKTKKTLATGKSFKIKAETILEDMTKKLLKPSVARLRYESSDISVAKVNSSGKVTAVGKGTCYVRVFALNGVSVKIKITVK
ncbi:MAG: Ig-like domain-containing protein [Lachnospiraceae bacterium]|nr:Ig-like domain-containing protein [Lachnospiraceae bacterium]